MKQCPTCKEEFADKFGFCPVDGTPLGVAVAEPAPAPAAHASDESFLTAAAASNGNGSAPHEEFTVAEEETVSSHAAPAGRGEYHLTIIQEEGLTRRLAREVKAVAHDAELTWPEFKKDPVGFTRRSAAAYGNATWKFISQRNVAVALAAAFLVVGSVVGLIIALERVRSRHLASANPYENLELVGYVDNEIPKEQPTPEKGTAGTNEGKGGGSKPKFEKPAGGGGGGRQEQTPASAGKLPTAQLEVPPILTAPKP